jgi:hypothetical protein
MIAKTELPVFRGRGRPRIYPLDQMDVGESMEFATTYDIISKCARQLTRKGAGRMRWKFKVEILAPKSVRVWRVK